MLSFSNVAALMPRQMGFVAGGSKGPSVARFVKSSVQLGAASQLLSFKALAMSTVSGDQTSFNPLLQPEGLPKFGKFSPENVIPAVEGLLEKLETDFKELEKRLKNPSDSECWTMGRNLYSFETVVDELERIQDPLWYAWGIVGHLNGVKNSEALREAYLQMQPKVVKISTMMGQSKAVYKAMKALQSKSHARFLNEAQTRIIESSVRGMKLSGVGLEGDEKERFNELRMRMAELRTTFSNNVLDSTKAFELTLTDPEEVKGLPDSALALAAQTAKSKGHSDATAETGPWVITLDIPSYLPAMQHLKSSEIREKLYRAYNTRASTGDVDNAPIINEVLAIRKEMANILGFSTYAEMSLASKMAPSVEAVDELSEFLREKAYPAAQKEFAQLQEYATSNGYSGDLKLWDVAFWSERQKEELYSFKEEELRPYFPLPSVLEGMFGLANRLFGIVIEQAMEGGEVEVWHEDVQYFLVKNEAGEQIASFYLDPYSRPAEKRGGAWMSRCLNKSKVMNRNPVAYLTCNGSPPVGDTPSLMTFREVETLFHEFGHGLQHMLTKVEDSGAAGISNIEWDAVELPSQFMENWCYDESTIYKFAKHYETGEPLPKDLFEKLKAQKTYHAGMMMCRQLNLGQVDIELHHRYNPNEDSDVTPFDVQKEVSKKYSILPPLPEDRFLCTFSHIFAGGYSAGYYSYKWAEVMSADAFAAFEEVGLEKEEAVRETGARFRDTVLSLGGSRAPMQAFKDFRGREPSPKALLSHSGLEK